LDTGYVIRLERVTTVPFFAARGRARVPAPLGGLVGEDGLGTARHPPGRGGAARRGTLDGDAVTLCEPRRAQPSELT